ncbi:MAG: hypothetical protein ACFFCS_07930 [Candidatus Hodarchaeota archaeon]
MKKKPECETNSSNKHFHEGKKRGAYATVTLTKPWHLTAKPRKTKWFWSCQP